MFEAILVVIILISGAHGDCGHPGYSREARPEIEDRPLFSFREGETIIYSCQQYGDIVIGNMNRTCKNNEWSGVVPKCASPITSLVKVDDKNYYFFTNNNTVLLKTLQPLKIVGIRVTINFRYTINPESVTLTQVSNIPDQRCFTTKSVGNQGSEFNQTYTFTCFTKITDMNNFERHNQVSIGFSHSLQCTSCVGLVREAEIFQVDTDECNMPDQPRYGKSIVQDSHQPSSGRAARMSDSPFKSNESLSTMDRTRVGSHQIFFPTGEIVIKYACEDDFVSDNPERKFIQRCSEGGSWAGDADSGQICKPLFTCSTKRLKIPDDGSVIANFSDKWSSKESVAGGYAFFTCLNPDYKIADVTESRCLRDGNWTDSEPRCVERAEGEYVPSEEGPPMKYKRSSATKWILTGLATVTVGVLIVGGLVYYFMYHNNNYSSGMKPSTQIAMSQSSSRFPDGSCIPKRPGIPIPVTSNPSFSTQQPNYLSHDSIHFDGGKRYTDIFSPTYEEINPLTSEEAYNVMQPWVEEEPGYYSASNSSKRGPDEEVRRSESEQYVQMNEGQSVLLRKH